MKIIGMIFHPFKTLGKAKYYSVQEMRVTVLLTFFILLGVSLSVYSHKHGGWIEYFFGIVTFIIVMMILFSGTYLIGKSFGGKTSYLKILSGSALCLIPGVYGALIFSFFSSLFDSVGGRHIQGILGDISFVFLWFIVVPIIGACFLISLLLIFKMFRTYHEIESTTKSVLGALLACLWSTILYLFIGLSVALSGAIT